METRLKTVGGGVRGHWGQSLQVKQELFAQTTLSVSHWSWLQVQSPRLCPNDRLTIHCSLFSIHIKLIWFPEGVSGVSRRPWCSFPSMALTRLWRRLSNSACWAHILKNIIFFQKNISVLVISACFCKLRNELCQIVLLFFSLVGLFAV